MKLATITSLPSLIKNNAEFVLRCIFIVLGVAWFTWTFEDGLLWIAIFGAGFYLGTKCADDYE